MHPYEAVWGALLDPVVCGRPEGHAGRHRSVQAIRKERDRAREKWPVYRERRQQKRDAERLLASVEAAARQARDRDLATRKVKW